MKGEVAVADVPVERAGGVADTAAVVVKFVAALGLAVAVEARPVVEGLGDFPAVVGFDQPEEAAGSRMVEQVFAPIAFGDDAGGAFEGVHQVEGGLGFEFFFVYRADDDVVAAAQFALAADGQGKCFLLGGAHGVGFDEFDCAVDGFQVAAAARAEDVVGQSVHPVYGRAAVGAVFGLARAFQTACTGGDLVFGAQVFQLQVVEFDGVAGVEGRRVVAVVGGEEEVFATPVCGSAFDVAVEFKRQLALCGGVFHRDAAHVGGHEAFAVVVEGAEAGADVVEGGELECGFGLRAGQGIDVAGFGQPARAAFVEQDVPFVPHARVVVHLQTADDVERGRAVAAARADLQRAEVFQQGGVAAFVDDAAVLAYQHAVAVAADQRNRGGGMGVYGCAAAWAVGMEEGFAHGRYFLGGRVANYTVLVFRRPLCMRQEAV